MVTENINNNKLTGFTLDSILNLIELLFKHLKHRNQTITFLLESNNFEFKDNTAAAKYLALHELDTKIHNEIKCLMKKISGKE
jgi:transposase